MHYAAKLLDALCQPPVWVLTLLVLAWLMTPRTARSARSLQLGAITLLLASGWLPLPDLLLRQLEGQYAERSPEAPTTAYAGVIVLGGALSAGYLAEDHQQPLLNDAAERMTAAVALQQRNPKLTIVFTGGEGAAFESGPPEAARARNFFVSMGLAPDTLLLEDKSRNTYENARLTAQLPGVDKHRPWLLLTSAWHMPRSMQVFQAQGWNVTAHPVDFRTAHQTPWSRYSLTEAPTAWQLALHEYIGLLAYRLLGRL